MTSDERHYWPTDSHLQQLRAEGEMPYGRFAAQCIGVAVAIGVLYLTVPSFSEISQGLKSALLTPAPHATTIGLFGNLLIQIVLVPAVVVAGAIFLCGLLQTRFWLGFERVSLDLSKLMPRVSLNPIKFLGRVFVAVLLTAAVVAVAGLCGLMVLRAVLPLINSDVASFSVWCAELSKRGAFVTLAAMLILGIVGILMSVLVFRFQHRMTKEELERDLRESGA